MQEQQILAVDFGAVNNGFNQVQNSIDGTANVALPIGLAVLAIACLSFVLKRFLSV